MPDGTVNKCKDCTKKRVKAYAASERGKEVDRKRQQKPARKEWMGKHSVLMREKHKGKRSCRVKFWTEYKKGTIKKTPCIECGTEALVEAHHSDYNKPYDVMWLCSLHHKEWHRNNKAIQPWT